jgi:DNA processing protein
MHDPKAIELAWLSLLRTSFQGGAVALREAMAAGDDIIALTRHSPPTAQTLQDQQWLQRAGATLLPCTHPDYPAQLTALTDSPLALFVLGDVALLREPQLAVVGSRQPTAAGQRIATQMTQQLCAAGLVITSGLARGIDAAAQAAALDCGGRTIAVCGTGLDQCYPPQNQRLFERICRQGAVVSEFLPGTAARRQNFPRRNRIISGLSRGVVVIEAAAGSGSLITARRALDQGREVFAVPGSPLNPLAAGCLELIRSGGAHLVRDATDILTEISISIEGNTNTHQQLATRNQATGTGHLLDKDYEMLLDALGFEPASIDDLVDRTGLAAGSVASMMLILALDGRVETRPGALYNRVS